MRKNYDPTLHYKNVIYILAFFVYSNVFAQCLTPDTPTVGTVTTSTARLNFSSTIAYSTIEWGEAGFIPETTSSSGNLISGSGHDRIYNVNNYTIVGLEPNTTYDVYLRRNCGNDGFSANTPKVTFTTSNACAAVNVPYLEDFSSIVWSGFNNAGDYGLPECTRSINNIQDQKWRGDDFNGNAIASLSSNGASVVYFITKGVNLTAGTPYRVEFDTNSPSSIYYFAATSITAITNNNVWAGSGSVFTPPNTGVYYFGFRCDTNTGANTYRLDNITITDDTNPCPTPTGLSATGISSSEISVSYTSQAGNSCFIEYTPIYGGNTMTVLAPSSPYILSGLIPGRYYNIRIRRQCSTNSISNFSPVFGAWTIDCSSAPSSIVTDIIMANAARINWQSSAIANSYEIYHTTNSSFTPVTSTNPTFNTSNSNAMLTDLNSNTTYYYWVRSLCGSTKSDWSTRRQFTTANLTNCNIAEEVVPSTAFTPSCTGSLEGICYASTIETTLVNFLPNKQYTFTSSIATDYITITNALGVVYTSGQTPLTWSSGTNSGILTYIIHTNSSCGNDYPNFRIKYITCSDTVAGCASPFGLAANNISTDSAVLNWNAPVSVPANGYDYYYSLNNTAPSASTVPSGNSVANTIVVSDLSSGSTYYFWVRSRCGTTNSAWVSGGSFETLVTPSCGLPSNLSVFNITNDSAQFSWNAPTPAPTTGYQFYAVTTNVTPSNAIGTTGSIITDTFAGFNGLSSGTTYYYWVRSVCDTVASVWVSGGSFTTTGTTVCNAPLLPQTSNITTNSATISWTAPNPVPTNGYQYYYTTSSVAPDDNTIPQINTATASVTLTGLASGTLYRSWVRSNCGSGQSNWRIVGQFTTVSSGCDLPYNVQPSFNSSTSIAIRWTAPITAPSNGYDYYYNTTNTAPTAATVPSGNTTSLSQQLLNLISGTTYYFWVRSNCGSLQGAWVPCNPITTKCSMVTSLTETSLTSSSVSLSWTLQYPQAAPAVGYDYYYSTTLSTPDEPTPPSGSLTATSFTLSDLTSSTTYYYWVRSNCGDALTSWKYGGSFTTLAPPPTNDACNNPTALVPATTFNGGAIPGTIFNATTSVGITPSCQPQSFSDVWYTVVVPASGSITIETAAATSNSTDDTVIAAFTGNCGSLTEIGCNDDKVASTDLFSKVTLTGQTLGTLLHIAVWRYGTASAPIAESSFQIAAYNASLTTEIFDDGGFTALPNPVTDYLHLSFSQLISKVMIYNLLGQEVISRIGHSNQLEIDMSYLPSGTYLAKVVTGDGVKSVKLLKQ